MIASLRRQKNGEKFSRLFDQGDLSGYGSQSEADLALCSLIAYRAGDNPELIDAVFRSSQLYRDIWEREDYRSETIRKAVQLCGGQFHPAEGSHPPFVRFSLQEYILIPALLAKEFREMLMEYLHISDYSQKAKHYKKGTCYIHYTLTDETIGDEMGLPYWEI